MSIAAGILGRVRFVDLFSGLGGFRLALESIGGRCVMSSEIERCARETYHANFGEWPAGDITAIRAEDVPDHDVLCAGFPCQSFSIAGLKKGFADQTRGTLFFEIKRILQAKRPAVAFLENVRHLVSHDGGRTFGVIQRALVDLGYDVHHQIINASHYGLPTARKRVYIVAIRSDLHAGGFKFPEPTFEPAALADVLLPDDQTDEYVVRNYTFYPHQNDQEAVVLDGGGNALQLVSVGRIGPWESAKQGYRVYSPVGHAVTFLAKGGGPGAQTGLYWINGRVRKLAAREMARAMGFPDSFIIPPSLTYGQARRLFGNSVVVPVVRLIGERIVATLPQNTCP